MSVKVKLIGSSKIIMSNPQGSRPYFAWPTAVRLQNGLIAVGASGFRIEHICPFGKCVLAFSGDNGENYSEPMPIIDTVLDDRDAGLTVFGEKGLIITSFNNTLDFQQKNMPQTDECFEYINSVSSKDEAEALEAPSASAAIAERPSEKYINLPLPHLTAPLCSMTAAFCG